jgi:N-methylhydantoinase A
MALDPRLARRVLEKHVAGPLSFAVEEAAGAVVRISNAAMVRALRVVSVARGRDPRRFALVAFGGAGPMQRASGSGRRSNLRPPRFPIVSLAPPRIPTPSTSSS